MAGLITLGRPSLTQFTMQFSTLDYPFQIKKIKLNGSIEIAYADEGDGDEAILFIHGLGSYMPAWKKNIPVLKNKFRCVALDLPGYGKSSRAVHYGEMNFYSTVLKDFIEKLGLEKVSLAGHSMGGQIAINTALLYPEIVNKLILIAPAGFEEFSVEETKLTIKTCSPEYFSSTTTEMIKFIVRANFHNIPEDAQFMIDDRINVIGTEGFNNYCTVVSNSLRGMLDNPVNDKLSQIMQPTLVLFGLNDKFIPSRIFHKTTPEAIARAGAEKIPNSKLVLIPECGHFIPFEKPDEFNDAVSDFLEN